MKTCAITIISLLLFTFPAQAQQPQQQWRSGYLKTTCGGVDVAVKDASVVLLATDHTEAFLTKTITQGAYSVPMEKGITCTVHIDYLMRPVADITATISSSEEQMSFVAADCITKPKHSVTGIVFAPCVTIQSPLGGAEIQVGGKKTTSTGDGMFRVDGLETGSYTLMATYKDAVTIQPVETGQITAVHIDTPDRCIDDTDPDEPKVVYRLWLPEVSK